MEILLWGSVGLYIVSVFYVLAENLTGAHVKTRDVADVVRIASEAVAWPLVVLPWRELPGWLRAQWAAAEPRYAGVGS